MALTVRIGSLLLTLEPEAELLVSQHGVHDMRRLLLRALGMRPGGAMILMAHIGVTARILRRN